MPVTLGVYVAPTWVNGTSPAIDDDELNAISETLECVPVANGGTGSTTAAAALTALGALAASKVTSKGSSTQPVYFDANGNAVPISYTIQKSVPSNAVFTDTTALGSMSGTLGVSQGGTGATSAANARTNLGTVAKTDFTNKGDNTSPVYCDSTGKAVAVAYVSLAKGGTGATNGATGLANLFAAGNTVLSAYQYGQNLPASGVTGQLFFKKI